MSAWRQASGLGARAAGRVGVAVIVALALSACGGRPRHPGAEELALRQRAAGETARRYDDPRTAASLYGRASANAAAVDRGALAADAACREGIALLAGNEPRRAEAAFLRGVALARDAREPGLAARASLGIARARQAAGAGDVAAAHRVARDHAGAAQDRIAEALAEVGLGALAPPAEARTRYAAAADLAGEVPPVAGPLRLNLARLDEREGRTADARAGYRAAIAPLAASDDRVGLLAALQAAARLAGADPASAAEAAELHRRAAAVADGLGRDAVAREERALAER